jgi:hypothetical protein
MKTAIPSSTVVLHIVPCTSQQLLTTCTPSKKPLKRKEAVGVSRHQLKYSTPSLFLSRKSLIGPNLFRCRYDDHLQDSKMLHQSINATVDQITLAAHERHSSHPAGLLDWGIVASSLWLESRGRLVACDDAKLSRIYSVKICVRKEHVGGSFVAE